MQGGGTETEDKHDSMELCFKSRNKLEAIKFEPLKGNLSNNEITFF